ncbi:MAG: FAD-dependent oxidoreductase [Holophaga sp.]|nr:FAD-dependent oxidoreductase [Holophaga sp.]
MSDCAPLPSDSFDLCVVGAGISGLCLAQMAAGHGQRTLVLEQRPEAGGCLCSAPVGDSGWLELGAHTCYNSYRRFLDVMAGTDFLTRATPRKSMGFRMVEQGALRSIPSCLNFWEAALALPRMFGARKAGRTAAEYYSRILGARNWARVLHPALNAVASQETQGFPADALFKPRNGRRKDVVKSFAVRGGLGPAVQALGRLPGIHCALDQGAVELLRTPAGFQLRTSRGETVQARRVALAVPPDVAAALLAPAFPELAAHLGRIETRTVKTLGLVFRDPLAHLPRLTGLILPEGPCFSAVSADTFPVPGRRAWAFHFGSAAEEGEMAGYACRVLGARPDQVEASFRRDHTMPAMAMGHDAWLQALDAKLPGSGLMVVGNYLSGLSIEDCAGRALAESQRVWPGEGVSSVVGQPPSR